MRLFCIALGALLVAGSSQSRAEYPDRVIQIVVPYTPGGTVDLLARALAPRFTAAWGQPVVIINGQAVDPPKMSLITIADHLGIVIFRIENENRPDLLIRNIHLAL